MPTYADIAAINAATNKAQQAAQAAYQAGMLGNQGEYLALARAQFAWQQEMDKAGLTGMYQGAYTMPTQQWFAGSFGSWGTPQAGQQTLEGQAQQFGQGLQAAQFQAQQQQAAQQNAQAYLQLLSQLRGPADWAKYQQVLGSTPGGMRDLVAAAMGQYVPGGGATTGVSPEAVSLQSMMGQVGGQPWGPAQGLQLPGTIASPTPYSPTQPGAPGSVPPGTPGAPVAQGGPSANRPIFDQAGGAGQQLGGNPFVGYERGTAPQQPVGNVTSLGTTTGYYNPAMGGGAPGGQFGAQGSSFADQFRAAMGGGGGAGGGGQTMYFNPNQVGGAAPGGQLAPGGLQLPPRGGEGPPPQQPGTGTQQEAMGGGANIFSRLPAPNQIAPQSWKNLAPSQQQMLLGGWESQGWDKNDVTALFNQSLPRYAANAPTAGTWRMGR